MESVKEQPELCKADAHEVMASFLQVMAPQQQELNESDPQIISIQTAIP